jgi:hypothetical protein
MSDLLILSIEKKDLFLSVAAREYLPTCFANSLHRLARLVDPIRETKAEVLNEIVESEEKGEGGEVGGEKMSVVRPAFRMLDFLAEYGLEREDVFLVPGDGELVDLIRECLDTVRLLSVAQETSLI